MANSVQSGDNCPECDGHLVVYSGHTRGATHVKYLRCWQCKKAPPNNKVTIKASQVSKRRPRKSQAKFCPNNVTTPATSVAEGEIITQR